MQRTEPELERSATEQLAKENGPACFVVVDSGGQKLATFISRMNPVGVTEDEARRIAANIGKLPNLLRKD